MQKSRAAHGMVSITKKKKGGTVSTTPGRTGTDRQNCSWGNNKKEGQERKVQQEGHPPQVFRGQEEKEIQKAGVSAVQTEVKERKRARRSSPFK